MCIIVNNNIPLIAENDIQVRKILVWNRRLNSFVTPYQSDIVGLNNIQESKNKENIEIKYDSYRISDGYVFSYGMDGLIDYPPNCEKRFLRVFNAYIPKGTEYYVSRTDNDKTYAIEYASKALFITSEVRYTQYEYRMYEKILEMVSCYEQLYIDISRNNLFGLNNYYDTSARIEFLNELKLTTNRGYRITLLPPSSNVVYTKHDKEHITLSLYGKELLILHDLCEDAYSEHKFKVLSIKRHCNAIWYLFIVWLRQIFYKNKNLMTCI